jgi:cytochrome c biogenesis protein CcdA
MLEKFNQLNFVIGFFFTLVALVLLLGYFFIAFLHHQINLYTGIGLLVFGLMMIKLKGEESTDPDL